MTSSRDFETAIEREVSEWPGVSLAWERGAKHPQVVLGFGEASRFMPYPGTPSDRRGIANQRMYLRRELTGMGAVRNARLKSTRERSERNPGAAMREMPGGERAEAKAGPWDVLADLAARPLITAPGFHVDITPDQYFAEPCPEAALTNSGIGTLLKYCPARFAHAHPGIGQPEEDRKETAATHMGSLVHRLALGKGSDYIVSPHDEYRSKEAKAWRAEIVESGVIPVKQAVWDDAQAMASVIKKAINDALGGVEYQTEVVIAWKMRDRWCRAMIDVWCPSLCKALDVKTIVSADDLSVDRAFASGYGRQEAWYLGGLGAVLPDARPSFDFLFVEKEAPWLARPVSSTEAMRHGSRLEIERAFRIFDACMTAGEWPGYAPRRVFPTSWQLREWTEAEFQEAAE